MAADPIEQHVSGAAETRSASGLPRCAGQVYSQLESMPPLPALKSLAELGTDLLRRTAELPDTERGLLSVLAEYRYAVFAFVAVSARV